MQYHLVSNGILIIYLIIVSGIFSYLVYQDIGSRSGILIGYHITNLAGIIYHWHLSYNKYQKQYLVKKETINKECNNKIENMQQSINYILHEIKNLLNPLYIILQNNSDRKIKMHIDYNRLKGMQNTIENCIKLCTNILSFENLLRQKYIPQQNIYQLSYCISNLMNLTRNYYQGITISSNILPETNILIDLDKYNQITQNGLNAIMEFGNNREINIRVNYLINDGVDYLLTEIINSIEDIEMDKINDRNLFIPNLMTKNNDIWKEYQYIFKLDKSFLSIVESYLGTNILKYIIVINEKFSKKVQYQIHKSLGLSLPISRLISKNLGGESNFQLVLDRGKNKNLIRFWSLIKINKQNEKKINPAHKFADLEEIPL